MKTIGFINDVRDDFSRNFSHTNARTWRMVPMANYCRQHGAELFIYSRYHVNTDTKMAFGYVVDEDQFIPVIRPVPQNNGEWFYETAPAKNRNGLSRPRFAQWAVEQGIHLFPSHAFNEAVSNKLHSYGVIYEHDKSLQPYTEEYQATVEQFTRFFELKSKLFIKPTHGSQGENIFVITNTQGQYKLAHYRQKTEVVHALLQIEDAIAIIKADKRKDDYVIQVGVDVAHFDGGPFIIRSILLDDGKNWNALHKVVVAQGSSDVANTTQGGKNFTIDEVFEAIFGGKATQYKKRLDKTSTSVAKYLEKKFPKQVMELGLDFVMKKNNEFILLEVNTHPGLMKPGMEHLVCFNDIFIPSGDELRIYKQYLKPHGECLAKFLLAQCESI